MQAIDNYYILLRNDMMMMCWMDINDAGKSSKYSV